MRYVVREVELSAQPTAVVAEATTWKVFPALWPQLLERVLTAVRSEGSISPGRNVMLYKDDVPNVEVGVEVAAPFAQMGAVVSSYLPPGRAAMTRHIGRYEDLGLAHRAIIEWCDRLELQRVGPRFDLYGRWRDDSADQEVEFYYLVR